MPEDRLVEKNFRFLGLGLLPDGVLEIEELIFRQSNEERLEEHDGFPEASVEVEVIDVHRIPGAQGIG
jgi:hypothetical protein